LLAPFDLAGIVVTADALHTHRGHARWLVEKKAHYVLVVKRNQPALHDALRHLPWKEMTARAYEREAGHGRRETHSVRALTVTDLHLDFPHVAAKIHRHRTDLKTGKITRETVCTITDLPARAASPQVIGRLARAAPAVNLICPVRVCPASFRCNSGCVSYRRPMESRPSKAMSKAWSAGSAEHGTPMDVFRRPRDTPPTQQTAAPAKITADQPTRNETRRLGGRSDLLIKVGRRVVRGHASPVRSAPRPGGRLR
jgi:predicted transposase YbfD/YdcC